MTSVTRRTRVGLAAALVLVLVVVAVGVRLRRVDERDAQREAGEHELAIRALREERGEYAGVGRWRELPVHRREDLSDEQRRAISELEAIGYASGSREGDGGGAAGVGVHDRARAWRGLNLYTSGHAPEAILMDMDGAVLHRWRRAFLEVWPDYPVGQITPGMQYWRRAHLDRNGDLIVIFEAMGIMKLDARSGVLWANGCRAHHDLEVMPDGSVYVLTREPRLIPRISREHPILEDFICVLDTEGRVSRKVSMIDALESAGFDLSLEVGSTLGDILHTNTLEVLDGRIADRVPAFAAGNVLTSLRAPSTIAVVDLAQRKVVWAARGDFKGQHDPKVVDGGNLLLFDNSGTPNRSKVVELDPVDSSVVWSYRGTRQSPFWSDTCGAAQRLPNGNTLITESDGGRAFEVTRAKDIVWEFQNPARAGEDGRYIATIFEMQRLPSDFPLDWVPR